MRALFEASGVIRVDTLGDLFDVALLLDLAAAAGRRAGGRRRQLDRARRAGHQRAAPRRAAAGPPRRRRRGRARRRASSGAARGARRRRASTRWSSCSCRRCSAASAEDVAAALRTVAAASGKPVLSTFLGFEGVPGALAAAGDVVAGAAGRCRPTRRRSAPCGRWRGPCGTRRGGSATRASCPALDGIDLDAARAVVAAAAGRDAGRPRAGRATRRGVLLGAVGIALADAADAPSDGVEVVLTVHDDRSFGALVSFGVGGVATELLGDRAYAAVPLTTADADDLIAAPRAAPLLDGYGGGAGRSGRAGRSRPAAVRARRRAARDRRVRAGRHRARRRRGRRPRRGVGGAADRAADTGPRRLRGL